MARIPGSSEAKFDTLQFEGNVNLEVNSQKKRVFLSHWEYENFKIKTCIQIVHNVKKNKLDEQNVRT